MTIQDSLQELYERTDDAGDGIWSATYGEVIDWKALTLLAGELRDIAADLDRLVRRHEV